MQVAFYVAFGGKKQAPKQNAVALLLYGSKELKSHVAEKANAR